MGRQDTQPATGRASRTVVLCVTLVLALFGVLSMAVGHIETGHTEAGHPDPAAAHPYEVATSGATERLQHSERHGAAAPTTAEVPAPEALGGSEDPRTGDSESTEDREESHHHHLVEVDAGVVLAISVPAPDRAVAPRPMTAAAVPVSLSDGGGRPD
ncbi:hypothetical protein [Jannaschia sp. R86511]|uniref:hypothetical protein n=1 Tax=Jannaschia sp. R86511 TaxID=3093853 RepID=UPI0036D38811